LNFDVATTSSVSYPTGIVEAWHPKLRIGNEQSQDERQVRASPSGKRPWQFSLRSLFILTTAVAVVLSLAVTFRPVAFFLFASALMLVALGVALAATVIIVGCSALVCWPLDLLLRTTKVNRDQGAAVSGCSSKPE